MITKKVFLIILFSLSIFTLSAQPKIIGTIDVYGSKSFTKAQIKSLINVSEGDPVPNVTEVERKLLDIAGVKKVNVKVICCEIGKPVLFIGLAEEWKDTLKWNVIKGRAYHLPDTLVRLHDLFYAAMKRAVTNNDNADDFSEGHSLLKNPEARAYQLSFKKLADVYFKTLKNVLLNSALPAQRERAAVIIAYASNKMEVVKIYEKAVYDPNPEVRNNVFRALPGIAVYQKKNPMVRMPGMDLFPKMLNSIYWSDRDKAMFALMAVTETKNSELFKVLKKESSTALVEMANWQSSGHAMLAYTLLGRIYGMNDAEIYRTWSENKRNILFDKVKFGT